jgi:hypothetical protein
MLLLTIHGDELFDDSAQEFVATDLVTLGLEHSLVSLSKWESQWEKPFLATNDKSEAQVLDYVKKMIVGPIPPEEVFSRLSDANVNEINAYINAKMTATWFNEPDKPNAGSEVVTAELIYYWMITLGVPFECQHWHLNRLLTLIKVCNYKNAPKKTMSFAEQAQSQRELNEQRKAQLGTRG